MRVHCKARRWLTLYFQTNKKRRSVKVTVCLFKALRATNPGSNTDRSNSGQSLPIAPAGQWWVMGDGQELCHGHGHSPRTPATTAPLLLWAGDVSSSTWSPPHHTAAAPARTQTPTPGQKPALVVGNHKPGQSHIFRYLVERTVREKVSSAAVEGPRWNISAG